MFEEVLLAGGGKNKLGAALLRRLFGGCPSPIWGKKKLDRNDDTRVPVLFIVYGPRDCSFFCVVYGVVVVVKRFLKRSNVGGVLAVCP